MKRIRRLFHLLVVLSLLHFLNLVDASLASSGNACKIDGNVVAALTVDPGRQGSVGGVEGESVDEGAASPLVQLGLSRGEGAPANKPIVRGLKNRKRIF